MRIPDPKANTTTEAYLAYKAGYLEESELKPVLYEPYLHFDAWLAYWAGLTSNYPSNMGKNLFIAKASASSYGMQNTQDPTTGIFHTTGTATQSWATIFKGQSIYIPAGTYTISVTKALPFTVVVRVWERPGDESSRRDYSIPAGQTSFTFTTDFNSKSVGGYASGLVSGREYDETFGVQLEAGSVATDFEPATIIPEMLCDEEALVAYLAGVTNTYPEDIKDPYDVRIVGYLKFLISAKYGRPEYPVTNEEFYLSSLDAPHTSNSTPSDDIELQTSKGKILDVKMYGNTAQVISTGKNLFDLHYASQGANTRCMGVVEGNSVTNMSTTDGTGFYSIVVPNSDDLLGKTVTVSVGSAVSTSKGRVILYQSLENSATSVGEWGVEVSSDIGDDGASKTIELPSSYSEGKNCFALLFYPGNKGGSTTAGDYAIYSNIQIEVGSSATSYEPYTDGLASPSPDREQRVDTVSSAQVVTVFSKNLFGAGANPNESYGILTTKDPDGRFNVSGTATQSWATNGRRIETFNITPGEYTMSISEVLSCDFVLRFWDINGKRVDYTIPSGQTALTFDIGFMASRMTWFIGGMTSGREYDFSFYAQLERGDTATEYEQFESQTKTVDLRGKNILDISSFAVGGMSSGNANVNSHRINNANNPIAVVPGSEYTISVQLVNPVKGYRIGIHECMADGTFLRDKGWQQLAGGGLTFTTSEDTYLIKFVGSLSTTSETVTNSNEDTTACSTVDEFMRGCTLQLEYGGSATEYAPYSPVELCKIDITNDLSRQDYIYKDNGDWYIHKETGKDTLDGTEALSKSSVEDNNSFYWARNSQPAGKNRFIGLDTTLIENTGAGIDYVYPYFCNRFVKKSTNDVIYTDCVGAGFNRPSTTNLNFRVGFGLSSSITTREDFVNWLVNNPITVYYPLDSNSWTDTKITDTALISQLDGLLDCDTYNGKTFIKVVAGAGSTLPALLKVEAYSY